MELPEDDDIDFKKEEIFNAIDTDSVKKRVLNKIGEKIDPKKLEEKQASEKTEKSEKLEQHKILENEVPKWYKMTKDEATGILMKHICYFNVETGILAIDKPYGLPSVGGPGVHLCVSRLMKPLKERLKIDYELYMMHRLDEYTTGVMLFATNKDTELKLRKMFTERMVIKQYLAITKNIPQHKEGEIKIPLIEREINNIHKVYLSPNYNEQTKILLERPRGENPKRNEALTKYRILDSNNGCALIECQPMTGFKHQIRAHLSYALDCPILGDHKYSHHLKLAPQKLPFGALKKLNIRQTKVRYLPMHLHAYRVILPEFTNSNANLFIQAKLPLHFLNNLKRLGMRLI